MQSALKITFREHRIRAANL